jgi:hypothetical protein
MAAPRDKVIITHAVRCDLHADDDAPTGHEIADRAIGA